VHSAINIENHLAQKFDFDQMTDIFARMPKLRDCTGVLDSDNARRLDL
jgi:hypothetical protein